jgi:tRNA(adenine34) deaminase
MERKANRMETLRAFMTTLAEGRHLAYMRKAMALARRALAADEVPVGALVVLEDRIIGRGCNQSICRSDPTAHAEMLALRRAARKVGNYRLTSATVYCTLEPCAMCAGALVQARVRLLVYGARDPKAGAVHSQLNLLGAQFHNHRVSILSGVMEAESGQLLQDFFWAKRRKR